MKWRIEEIFSKPSPTEEIASNKNFAWTVIVPF